MIGKWGPEDRFKFLELNNISMIEAVIWDMDGVIIESEPYHIKAEIETLSEQGINITPEVAKEYFGLRTEDYFKALAKRYKKDLPIENMLKTHARILPKYYLQSPLVPHVKETLASLQKIYKQGLATSTKREFAEVSLNKFSLSGYFEAKVFGDEVEKGKPDPEMFLATAKKLGVEPRNAVVIEDAENGFKAGRAAGMKVIGRQAEHNKNQDFSLADYIITDLREISGILGRMP